MFRGFKVRSDANSLVAKEASDSANNSANLSSKDKDNSNNVPAGLVNASSPADPSISIQNIEEALQEEELLNASLNGKGKLQEIKFGSRIAQSNMKSRVSEGKQHEEIEIYSNVVNLDILSEAGIVFCPGFHRTAQIVPKMEQSSEISSISSENRANVNDSRPVQAPHSDFPAFPAMSELQESYSPTILPAIPPQARQFLAQQQQNSLLRGFIPLGGLSNREKEAATETNDGDTPQYMAQSAVLPSLPNPNIVPASISKTIFAPRHATLNSELNSPSSALNQGNIAGDPNNPVIPSWQMSSAVSSLLRKIARNDNNKQNSSEKNSSSGNSNKNSSDSTAEISLHETNISAIQDIPLPSPVPTELVEKPLNKPEISAAQPNLSKPDPNAAKPAETSDDSSNPGLFSRVLRFFGLGGEAKAQENGGKAGESPVMRELPFYAHQRRIVIIGIHVSLAPPDRYHREKLQAFAFY
jgi:hypothetical protein